MIAARISGTGSYRPGSPIAREAADPKSPAAALRHVAAPGDTSVAMGLEAAQSALTASGLAAEDLDGAFVFSGLPDYVFPKDGNAIVHELGAGRAACWTVDTACASFITALDLARLKIATGQNQHVLVLMIMNWVARALGPGHDTSAIGDGAAAVIVSADPDGRESHLGVREETHGDHFGYLELASPFVERSIDPVTLPELTFGADPKHGRFLMSGCLAAAKQLLSETGTAPDDIDWFVPHQPGRRLPRIWARALGIPEERVLESYDSCGNLSAVNIPMTLALGADGQLGAARIERGQRLLFFAPGAGLHVAAMLWRW